MTTFTQQLAGILRIGKLLAWREWIPSFYYAGTREGKGAGLEDMLGET